MRRVQVEIAKNDIVLSDSPPPSSHVENTNIENEMKDSKTPTLRRVPAILAKKPVDYSGISCSSLASNIFEKDYVFYRN